MPRYRCSRCNKDWARGGATRDCPGCGKGGPHENVALGFDGKISTLQMLSHSPKKG